MLYFKLYIILGEKMNWIRVIEEAQATGLLKELYEEHSKRTGRILNIWKVQSLNPKAFELHSSMYKNLMYGKSGLSRVEREMMALVVSVLNHCIYSVNHHATALLKLTKDEHLVEQLKKNYIDAKLDEKTRAILDYSAKITKYPNAVQKSDIEKLRELGFNDKDILDIALIASHYNFENRLVMSIGVELEENFEKEYDEHEEESE
jgi:uncharacterized peroxidase-related enzyme